MLLASAIVVLLLALFGLSAIILADIRAKGRGLWLATLHSWQGTLGTVAGFLSAAGVLMLTNAIQTNAEASQERRAASAIGQALAYEVERLVGPLQTRYSVASQYDVAGANVAADCRTLIEDLNASLIDETPVYNAVLGRTLDFGDYNLALFTRIYGYYHDFRREMAIGPDRLCSRDPAGEIEDVLSVIYSGFQYYQFVRASYPMVTPLQDDIVVDQA